MIAIAQTSALTVLHACCCFRTCRSAEVLVLVIMYLLTSEKQCKYHFQGIRLHKLKVGHMSIAVLKLLEPQVSTNHNETKVVCVVSVTYDCRVRTGPPSFARHVNTGQPRQFIQSRTTYDRTIFPLRLPFKLRYN